MGTIVITDPPNNPPPQSRPLMVQGTLVLGGKFSGAITCTVSTPGVADVVAGPFSLGSATTWSTVIGGLAPTPEGEVSTLVARLFDEPNGTEIATPASVELVIV